MASRIEMAVCETCGKEFDRDSDDQGCLEDVVFVTTLNVADEDHCNDCVRANLRHFECCLCKRNLEVMTGRFPWDVAASFFVGFIIEEGKYEGSYDSAYVCYSCDEELGLTDAYDEAMSDSDLEEEIVRASQGDLDVSEEAMWEAEARRSD